MRELARVGFDTGHATAGSPEDLSALLDGTTYDLVLTEYTAPGWSWRAALEALRGYPEPVPLIVLSHDSDPRLLMNCVLEGAACGRRRRGRSCRAARGWHRPQQG